jgi:SAM-dependent methyltransferase
MNIQSFIDNELVKTNDNVWQLRGHTTFSYSDGTKTERYLERVFRAAKDLSTRSAELQSWIKDWPSEYHLTTKRAQLLSGFSFDRSKRVLEVGCGCGAITRHLGESFDQVVSVEGNLDRARLARLRTRDLDSVSLICAPFQEIRFRQKFDIIFCIGVFEYSGAFIPGDDPYEEALRYFAEMLTPNGILVVAIENQFGLKYFSCAREDHVGTMFEGLEGYHRRPPEVRTFGKGELQGLLQRHFTNVEFYYPYPDYKLPECVLASSFVASGRAGELISQLKPRDYSGEMHRYWDDSAAALELARNGMLEFFANSFIAVAGGGALDAVRFPQQGVLYSAGRKPSFSTRTRVLGDAAGKLRVVKELISGAHEAESGPLRLLTHEGSWVDMLSLQTQLQLRARMRTRSLADIFAPCKPWLNQLASEAYEQGGQLVLGGDHVDSIWSNAYVVGDECRVIDREYVWRDALPLHVVVIRAIYNLLAKLDDGLPVSDSLRARCGRELISDIAVAIGVELSAPDFDGFVEVETELQWQVFGVPKQRHTIYLRWFFADRVTLKTFMSLKERAYRLRASVAARLSPSA